MKKWIDVNLKWFIPDHDVVLSKDYAQEFYNSYEDERLDELLEKEFSNYFDLEVEALEICEKLGIDDYDDDNLDDNLERIKQACKSDELIDFYELDIRAGRRRRARIDYLANNKEYQKEMKDGTKCFSNSGLCEPGIQIEVKKADGSIVKYLVGDVNTHGCSDYGEDGIENDDVVLRYRKLI